MNNPTSGLYSESFEHDACGIGAVVSIDGVKSHSIVDRALSIVEKLEHRAGKDADGATGDGVGILTQIPHAFFKKTASSLGIDLSDERGYGVGMFFFPQDTLARSQAMKMFEVIAAKEGVPFLGWREVPVNSGVLGKRARDCMPFIMQCFLGKPVSLAKGLDFDRRLYIIRRVFEQSNDNTYVCSLSSRTIVYKGMFLVGQLRAFYPDLEEAVQKAEKELETVKIEDEVTDVICEECGRNMVIKYGPHGKFLACPGFPECRNTKPYLEKIGVPCPVCGKDVVIRKTKKGRKYYGCENNPECEFMSWQKPSKEKCPECGGYMLEKGNKLVCADEKCGYVTALNKKKE